jgi:hypothetical protein
MVFRNTSTPGAISFASPVICSTDTSGFGHPVALEVHDLDGDGKPDLAVVNKNSAYITFFRNTTATAGGTISFGTRVNNFLVYSPTSLSIKDLDGNGKPDITIGFEDNLVLVLSNTSTIGTISFTRGINYPPNSSYGLSGIGTIDLNEDDKPDIAMATADNGFSRMVNQSFRGTHIIAPSVNYGPNLTSKGIAIDDLDGDGRADIAIANLFNKSISATKNNYNLIDTAYFKPAVEYSVNPAPIGPIAVATGDIDGDGKPDIAACITVNSFTNYLAILRNKIGEPARLCPNGGATFTSGLTGATYQWQLSTDNGVTFTNISDNANYTGTNTVSLLLNNLPSSWTGYQYRCVLNTGTSETFTIRFVNTWTGAIDAQWENPGNWSCGTVPDTYTDVVINPGAVVVLNSNTTIRTMTIRPGANFTINTGYTLIITN